jgi:hypothetical protein
MTAANVCSGSIAPAGYANRGSRHVRFAPKADKYADGAKKKKQKK